MRVLIVLFFYNVLVNCQHHKPSQDATILSDDRYLAGDGTFGAAYSQDDGVEFKEESDANGNRRGSYSYVDPNGQRHTVTYTAGKNGFQASGDHIPTASPPIAPQPEYEPLPQYNPPDYQFPASYQHARQQYQPAYYQYETEQSQPVYEYRPQPERPPQSLIEQVFQSIPSYRQQPRLDYKSVDPPQSLHHYRYQTTAKPEIPPPYTPPVATRRVYPPGKLNFNRTPDGFSYSFAKSK